MYNTHSKGFFNIISTFRVSWYFNMSGGNDFFYKNNKSKYIIVLNLAVNFFFLTNSSPEFQHSRLCTPLSNKWSQSLRIYQYTFILSFSWHRNFDHNLKFCCNSSSSISFLDFFLTAIQARNQCFCK